MIDEEKCPFCGCEYVDIGVDDREWTDDCTLVVWNNYYCHECKRTFVGNQVLKVVSRIVDVDDASVEGRIIGEEKTW